MLIEKPRLRLDKTDAMIKDNSMIAILADLYYDYSTNGKYIGLPDKFRELLFICYNAKNSLSEGLSKNMDQQSLSYIDTLLNYYNNALLPTYKI